MFILYDFIYLVFVIFYLPVFFLKKKKYPGFRMRLGVLPKDLSFEEPIWIHAVSVGEAQAIRGLAEGLRVKYPGKKLVISTVTPTGNKIARRIAAKGDFVFYFPLDLSLIVRKVIARIRPSLFIIVETEIWPNIISYISASGIPIVVVNGRISDNSFKGYYCCKFILKPLLNKVDTFCMQTQQDAQRLLALGVAPGKVKITGNVKFDLKDYSEGNVGAAGLKNKLGIAEHEKILVCGSTHPNEEEIILGAYIKISAQIKNLRLIIAPRHPERSNEISGLIKKFGLQPQLFSSLNTGLLNSKKGPVIIVDSVGQLLNFYAIADIVYIGGSLVKHGGQNILEPAIFAKPIIFGAHMFNFRNIADLFLKNQAAVLVHNKFELQEKIKYLLVNYQEAVALGERAKTLIGKNRGATQKTIEYIGKLF
ncbi:MAG: 3-deoxy-D-manno-octulosonic acid transferase [Candidatus Omnitrophota bacterium]|nr:3-deoxy-D-manno-octulosonic acid transferase [Candidatus Omnitrophota bacterium]MBU1929319.1 3-deoxy-D-manno-octulosonic acid transferase [Candidatus Omnitrophota bacterium]MBU2035611.1 3-deoxy-D-manno-octulosonic acid transferase [Candidatus Omnitrophota bacterium]MBU2221597.1 3-deoxy-D-manno-octulosonic acid transferase [Candidatus Omnitrophota bacterium]MBU2258136.1 3-deoxy-D-manno-octulosonic acid transferase [Candidatus Omnitrophota bacterium]